MCVSKLCVCEYVVCVGERESYDARQRRTATDGSGQKRTGADGSTQQKTRTPHKDVGKKQVFTASLFDHFVCRVSSQTLSMLRKTKTIRCSHYHFRSAQTLIPGVTREAVLRQETWFSFLSRKSESEHRYDPLRS